MFFYCYLSFFKISLRISAGLHSGTSLCNMPRVFSHYNYTYSLYCPSHLIKTGRSFSCYTKCKCWVYFSNIIENPVVLQKWLYSRFSIAIRDFGPWEACKSTIQETVLPPDATLFLVIRVWALLFHRLVVKWVHGCHHVVYISDDVISKISSSLSQKRSRTLVWLGIRRIPLQTNE